MLRLKRWLLTAAEYARALVGSRPLLRLLLRPLRHLLPSLKKPPLSAEAHAYRRWVAAHATLTAADRAAIERHITASPVRPLFSIVMPAYETPEHFLREAIASVQAQIYPHWELCVADDASPSPTVSQVLAEASAVDARIRWVRRESNGHISAASNTALAMIRGDWVVLMDHDDLLAPEALYELMAEIADHPDAQVIYSDEDKIDENGFRYGPYFKPDYDPDLLLGQNMVSHLGAYRRDLLERIGGFREGFEGSQDHDLTLRATLGHPPAAVRHIPRVLYHWRQNAGPASFSESFLARCIAASRRAVAEHLAAQGIAAEVTAAPLLSHFNRVLYPLPDPPPLVSVIVPTRDRAALLRDCLDGILHRTDYPAIEVLVADNGSTEPETKALFEELGGDTRLRILPMPGPFNYSRLNNRAAAEARGDVLLLLNNDTKVINGDWLRIMAAQAMRQGIGAVGCKLLYADDKVQHGGVVLGLGPAGIAGHFEPGAHRRDTGQFGWLALQRSVSAVTAACLTLRRSTFMEVGGFDEENLSIAYNDVDLCLRIAERGYRNVWTPFAELYHLESASRGDDLSGEKAARARQESAFMRDRWGPKLDNDAYWNPNLSLQTGRADLIEPPRQAKRWAAYL